MLQRKADRKEALQIIINLLISIITETLVYQKTLFPSRFTICSNFLGYTENNGAHRMNLKENIKENVCLDSLQIGVFLGNLARCYGADSGSAACHSIKEGFSYGQI